MSVSIVIPCFNEEQTVLALIDVCSHEIVSRLPGSEIIVVDDASTDNTALILKESTARTPSLRVITHPSNKGHGAALLTGYSSAKAEYVFQTDSDGQSDPRDFWKLYRLKDEADLCLGVRAGRKDPLSRRLLSGMVRLAAFVFFRVEVRDANCPFRLMRRGFLSEALRHIDPDTLAPNILISIYAARQKGLKETEIAHFPRPKGKTRGLSRWLLSFSARGFLQLLRFKTKAGYA